MNIKRATQKFREGEFVLIHDSSGREDETDMVLVAEKAEPEHITKMRKDAGGLICVAIHPEVAEKLGLPYLTKIYESASSKYRVLNSAEANDIPYDEHSSFSISVNHRNTFTGITDRDRALTIRELGKLSSNVFKNGAEADFGESFRTPGHVPILRASQKLLDERLGHTELSVTLAEMAGATPAVSVCEMMDGTTGRALTKEKARSYAERKGLVYLEGREILEEYNKQKNKEDTKNG